MGAACYHRRVTNALMCPVSRAAAAASRARSHVSPQHINSVTRWGQIWATRRHSNMEVDDRCRTGLDEKQNGTFESRRIFLKRCLHILNMFQSSKQLSPHCPALTVIDVSTNDSQAHVTLLFGHHSPHHALLCQSCLFCHQGNTANRTRLHSCVHVLLCQLGAVTRPLCRSPRSRSPPVRAGNLFKTRTPLHSGVTVIKRYMAG